MSIPFLRRHSKLIPYWLLTPRTEPSCETELGKLQGALLRRRGAIGRVVHHRLWWAASVSDRMYLGDAQDHHKAPWRPWVSEVDSAAAGEGRRKVRVTPPVGTGSCP